MTYLLSRAGPPGIITPVHARDTARLATPIGLVEVTGDEHVVHRVAVLADGAPARASAAAVAEAVVQLEQYFAGERRAFDVRLAPPTSPRGPAMRAAIASVGYGRTSTYGELAAAIGSGARAIGQACRTNAYPILVPCHRVLVAQGPDNYSAGSGLPTKQWLLAHERRHGSD